MHLKYKERCETRHSDNRDRFGRFARKARYKEWIVEYVVYSVFQAELLAIEQRIHRRIREDKALVDRWKRMQNGEVITEEETSTAKRKRIDEQRRMAAAKRKRLDEQRRMAAEQDAAAKRQKREAVNEQRAARAAARSARKTSANGSV